VEFPTQPVAWKEQTKMQANAGAEAHWEDLDFKCAGITLAQLQADTKLVVSVFDDNDGRADSLIGTGSASLLQAGAQGALGSDLDLELDIVDKKGKVAGRIVLLCSLTQEAPAAELKLKEGLLEGVVKVKKVVASGLKTGNMISKGRPTIQLQYGAWEGSTPAGEGNDPVWEYLTLQSAPAVGPEVLSAQPLVVNLLENGKVVASGSVDNMLLPGSQAGSDVRSRWRS
jgi:hypothetical protein